MTWETVLELVLALALVILTRYAVPYLKATLKAKDKEELALLIEDLVAAAEQVFSESGKGKEKKQYVVEALLTAGHDVDHEVNAMIEAAVYRLPEE